MRNLRELYSEDISADAGEPKDNRVVEPHYVGGDPVLKKHTRSALTDIKDYMSRKVGVAVDYFGDVTMRFARLPYHILGVNRLDTDEIAISDRLDPRKNPNVDPAVLRSVIGHELLHTAQKKTGSIREFVRKYGDNARHIIEGAVAYVTGQIFGDYSSYRQQKESYRGLVRKYGPRRAFLGAY